MTRAFSLGISALALTLTLSACNGANPLGPNPNAKVATVDGSVITRGEYDKTYKLISKNMGVDLENVSDPNQKQMIKQTLSQMVLNKLILDTLIENEAKVMNLTVSDQEVKDYKQKMLARDPSAAKELKKFLDENMMSEKDFNETLKQNILTEKVVEQKAGKQLAVSDAEVTAYYKEHPEQFKMPEQIRASHILIKAIPPQMARDIKAQSPNKPQAEVEQEVAKQKATLQAKAQKLYEDVKAHPDQFDDIAKRESNDPGSATQGGDLNYVVQNNIDPAFWAALKSTKPGQLHNGVVETQFGYHIIKVADIKPPKTSTLAEMKPMIHDFIESQKKQKVLMEWAETERNQAKIDIEPEFQPKAPAIPSGAPMVPGTNAGTGTQENSANPNADSGNVSLGGAKKH
ncbi:MAG: peptidylprolyl isomerase [Vampirovibrionales bacterium]|nr:peptidylprolyl isomerase [Vampirovibrionales bacterium]